MSGTLDGRVALVTGATSGIGEATAIAAAEAGARVMLTGRDGGKASAVLRRIEETGGAGDVILGDVALSSFCDEAVARTMSTYGRLDVLANIAGTMWRGDALDTDDEAWRRVMATNVDGAFFMARAAIRTMKETGGGAIINLASTVGLVGTAGMPAYCASKGAVVNLTRALALDHATDGIRVNAVCPGAVDTPMLVSGHRGAGNSPDEVLERNRAGIPQGRIPKPEEIARLIIFLACDDSLHITGAAISIDGGYTAR